jgi:hypothetical protein
MEDRLSITETRFRFVNMTPSEDMTTILEDLAAGRIDAGEAARRIDELSARDAAAEQAGPPGQATDAGAATDDSATDPTSASSSESGPDAQGGSDQAGDPWAASTDRPQQATHTRDEVRSETPRPGNSRRTPKTRSTNGVERLSVRAVGRRVRIVGEPSVATVSADGPHVLRRNGPILEISSDGEFGASIDGFQVLKATRSLDDFRSLGLGKELLLKVNPSLLVDAEVTAGSLNTEGIPRLGKIRVTAGGAKMLDVAEIADALIQAGQATVKGAIGSGRSRIRVESGSLSLQLADASNVTIATDAQLGKISWGGAHAGFTGDEVVVGTGSARLDVEIVMGHASIKAGTAAADATA